MASPTYSGIGTPVSLNGATSVSRPAVVAGDFMLLVAQSTYSDAETTPPAGWTLIQEIDPASVWSSEFAAYYKIAGSSEPSTYTVTISGQGGGSNFGAAAIFAWTGANATPLDASAQQNNASSTTSQAPSVVATVPETTLITLHSGGNSGVTITAPADMTQRYNGVIYSSTFEGKLAVFDQAIASAGATGVRSAALSPAAGTYAFSILIRGADGGGGGNKSMPAMPSLLARVPALRRR